MTERHQCINHQWEDDRASQALWYHDRASSVHWPSVGRWQSVTGTMITTRTSRKTSRKSKSAWQHQL